MTRLVPPDDGAVVRMYRQGHGDCFLLAFPREDGGEPVYVLIDCGFKPGSQAMVHGKSSQQIADHIAGATKKTIDLMIVTHEHQDHVNAIWKKAKPYFGPLAIHQAWMAWTEDPEDELAGTLRRRHGDQLLGLIAARRQLALAVGEDHGTVRRLDGLLGFEVGGEAEVPNLAAAGDPAASANKQAMKLIKDKAAAHEGVRYLSPGGKPIPVPGTAGVRAYVLGPPRDENLLEDEDPVGDEGFPTESGGHGLSFRAAVSAGAGGGEAHAPFPRRFQVPLDQALQRKFFRDHYGKDDEPAEVTNKSEVASDAAWRRIDGEWLFSAESLALKLNRGINNTSLVLAFELPRSKKVLLFVGDAQRGNWVSWSEHSWTADGRTVDARDLLARTVLYKVGHHGSHNATLAGDEADDYPNLAWMGRDVPADEFCAMVTAVREWALSVDWNHPLPSISQALAAKAGGRVLQTDTDEPVRPPSVSDAAWKRFTDRLTTNDFCFDLEFHDR